MAHDLKISSSQASTRFYLTIREAYDFHTRNGATINVGRDDRLLLIRKKKKIWNELLNNYKEYLLRNTPKPRPIEVPRGLHWINDDLTRDLAKKLAKRALDNSQTNWIGYLFMNLPQNIQEFENFVEHYRIETVLRSPFISDFLKTIRTSDMIRLFKTWESFEEAVAKLFDEKFNIASYV